MTRSNLHRIGALEVDAAAGDPTISRKVNSEASRIWEYCWRRMQKRNTQQLANSMQFFKPLLLYSVALASNIVSTNTYYLHEHISRAYMDQSREDIENARSITSSGAAAASAALAFP